MTAHQIRFINEYDNLVDKYIRLESFINTIENGKINTELNCPLELLKEQADIMWRYIEILWERSVYEEVDLNPVTNGTHEDYYEN